MVPPSLQPRSLIVSQSFRVSPVNGLGILTNSPKLFAVYPGDSNPGELPPKVPPRRESISPLPAKPELPAQLLSTTNEEQKPATVQQKIPKKLAAQPKEKEKGFKTKGSHQRAHSAGLLTAALRRIVSICLGDAASSLQNIDYSIYRVLSIW